MSLRQVIVKWAERSIPLIFILLSLDLLPSYAEDQIPSPKGVYVMTRYGNDPAQDGSEALPPNLVAGYPDGTVSILMALNGGTLERIEGKPTL